MHVGGFGNQVGYPLRVRESEGHGATIDRASLLAIDHSDSTDAFMGTHGPILGRVVPVHSAITGDDRDVTNFLDGSGSDAFWADSGSVVTLGTSVDSLGGAVIVDASTQGLAGVVIQVQQLHGGSWTDVGAIRPRKQFDRLAADSIGEGATRLIFNAPCAIRFAGRLASTNEEPLVQSCSLEGAVGAGGADERGAVASDDTLHAVLAESDTLWLSYGVPNQQAGTVRDLFFGVDATPMTSRDAVIARMEKQAVGLPVRFALHQNQPNPFRSGTTIRFDLPVGQMVRLEIFDAQGRRVRQLMNRFVPAGFQSIRWDQKDEAGSAVRPGVFFYRIQTQALHDRKKMVLLP